MQFDVPRLHKYEDQLERDSYENAILIIQQFYDIDDINTLTEEQKVDVQHFVTDMNEYSLMCFGFREVLNNWGI
ncbi:MAG: hypothetical protein P8O15_09940 [Luminiphilus sp.]|nr:hypothetical protein [Luminiphilus sp.]